MIISKEFCDGEETESLIQCLTEGIGEGTGSLLPWELEANHDESSTTSMENDTEGSEMDLHIQCVIEHVETDAEESEDEDSPTLPDFSCSGPSPLPPNLNADYSQATTKASSSRKKTFALSGAPRKILPQKPVQNDFVRTRHKLVNYRPGSFLGETAYKFEVPVVTTLLVVGMRGSGKSALINRINETMNFEASKVYRAPLSASDEQSGTHFLTEYLICKGNVSVFDTRGFTGSEVFEGMREPSQYMTKGVRDGQMELRSGDSKSLEEAIKLKGRHVHHAITNKRTVNAVIFVVNAVDFMDKKKQDETEALHKMKMLYENPYFSFRDERPVVAMTHMDKLNKAENVRARLALAKHLHIDTIDDIYNLSTAVNSSTHNCERRIATDNLLKMLTTALQRAERYLPNKQGVNQAVARHFVDFFTDSQALARHPTIDGILSAIVDFLLCVCISCILFIQFGKPKLRGSF